MIKNLFIIDGAAATGKTELLKFLNSKYSQTNYIGIVEKYSTREIRPEENDGILDLIPTTETEFENLKKEKGFKYYQYGDSQKQDSYGFFVNHIFDKLQKNDNVFIIIRNVPLAIELTKIFDNVRIVLVYIYTDEEKAKKRLKKLGYDDVGIKKRLERIKPAWDDFLTFNESYHEVIINNSSESDYIKSILGMLKYYNTDKPDFINIDYKERYNLLPVLKGFKNEIIKKISQTDYHKNIFLMMKYRQENLETYNYIKKIINELGYNCIRADEETDFDWNITKNVNNPLAVIYCCKYGIALFDEPEKGSNFSPNVAYELGIMHLQRKECLILKHTSLPNLPFDLLNNLYKPYTKEIELEKYIKVFIKNISE